MPIAEVYNRQPQQQPQHLNRRIIRRSKSTSINRQHNTP